jgi:outer membrane biosynthesis protein TonB
VRSAGKAFDGSALETIQHWMFEPAKCEGEPLPVLVNVEVSFHR